MTSTQSDVGEISNTKKNIIRLDGMSFISFIKLLVLIACIVIIVVFCFIKEPQRCVENSRVISSLCDDCNSCSNDFLDANLFCRNDNKLTGVPCGSTDPCFNHSLCTPTCNQGVCTGTQTCCLGYCTQDSDCPDINVTTFGIGKQCQLEFNACLYTMEQSSTSQCLGLLSDETFINCLDYRFTFTIDNTGLCEYWFKCAPLFFGTSKPAFVSSFANVTFYF